MRFCDNCGTELMGYAHNPHSVLCRACEYLASKLPHKEQYLTNRRWQIRLGREDKRNSEIENKPVHIRRSKPFIDSEE